MNRSTGAYVKTIWQDFAIVIAIPGEGYIETVKRAPSRRMALSMAFKGISDTAKLAMCKTADEMTREERGRYDMQTSADRVAEARESAACATPYYMLDLF